MVSGRTGTHKLPPNSSPSKNSAADIVRLAPYLDPEQIAQWIMGSPQHLDIIEQFVARDSEKETVYPTDPVKFMTETLGYQTWNKLEEICYGVRDRHNTVVASSFGVGKCQDIDDDIVMADGRVERAGNLIGRMFAILAFDEKTWDMRPSLAYANDNGIQDTITIKLLSGRKITRTLNHRLLTWDGWRLTASLKVGEKIAIPLKHPVFPSRRVSEDDIKLLAYLITEGGTSCGNPVVTQGYGKLHDEMVDIAKNYGCAARENGMSIRYSVDGNEFGTGKSDNIPNPVSTRIREWNLVSRAENKVLPDWVWEIPLDQVALLINRMMSGDGWVTSVRKNSRTELAYATSSPRLADQLQILLLRLGLSFNVSKRKTECLPSYTVCALDGTTILKALDAIGPILGKELACEKLKLHCIDKIASRYYPRKHDCLHYSAWGEIPRKYKHKFGFRVERVGGGQLTRNNIKELERETGTSINNGWSSSDIGWDEIVEIGSIQKRPTVAITVPETNAYVTSVIDHNSIVASALACWWMCLHDDAKVIVVAPTFSQIQNILFRYIRNVGRKANLPGELLDSPRWEISAEHFAIGLSPRRSSSEDIASIQGYHGAHLMVIMDEAAGLPRIIWDAAAGLVVGDQCRIVCIGNPIEQAGPFWEACNNPNWKHIAISAFDHPNVVEGREVIPGAVTRQWVEERAAEWATEVEPHTPGAVVIPWNNRWYLPQPIFYAKVMGIAPEQAEDQLIRLSWVLDAQDRILEQKHTEIIGGLDPARKGGDSSVLVVRNGNKVVNIKRWTGQDIVQLVDKVAVECRELGIQRVYVDEIGIGGGTTDYGRRIGLPFIGVNFARAASQRRRFANLRAEAWWRVRELLREGKLQIPNDSLLQGDLTAPKYGADMYQRILLESKDEIRERIKRSPDTGDALALSYATPMTDIDDGLVESLKDLGPSRGTHSGGITVAKWQSGRFSKQEHRTQRWKG